ncbi:uncharacterized protein LOC110017906 [Phalaenopsis equestris]|uniref:uncharacterized protein LOC110017906 n=1 Tax=Phalaenopsis equestris TaxID=78828 RepID=UPI0009E20F11|nr:uncharacterized protein LOC110017906 [Phalaenopsis equestris]
MGSAEDRLRTARFYSPRVGLVENNHLSSNGVLVLGTPSGGFTQWVTGKKEQEMLFRSGGSGGAAATGSMLVRYFSRKRSEDVRRINPKVPREQAMEISKSLYELIKQQGPISVSNTWNLVKESGINGLNSKTHMKIILKWMRGRKMLKLFCTHHGSTKRFLHSTLPEDSQTVPALRDSSPTPSSESPKSSKKEKLRKDYKRLLDPVAN